MTRIQRPDISPLVSSRFAADLDVLRYLPWECSAAADPVEFSSDEWMFNALSVWPRWHRSVPLRFERIHDEVWRLCAKEVALALMQPRIGVELRLAQARRKACPPWVLYTQQFCYWTRWFAWLSSEGVVSMREVTQHHCDSFLTTVPESCRHVAVSALRAFADYRELLTHDGYSAGFRPWGSLSAFQAGGATVEVGENKTPFIPDDVFAPLLAACLFLVETVGPDLLAAEDEYRRLSSLVRDKDVRGQRLDWLDEALVRYLDQLRANGLSLPSSGGYKTSRWLPDVNLSAIALNVGCSDAHSLAVEPRRSLLQTALGELGTAPGGLDTPMAQTLVGGETRSWTPGVSASYLRQLHSITVTACTIVIGALSGMRASELAAIRRTSLREDVGPGVVRFRVRSTLLKGQPPGGKPETWMVIEPVAQALSLAVELSGDNTQILRTINFKAHYRRLVCWVNQEGRRAGLSPIRGDWDLTLRQLRRKLAREIAWRPHGVIAGRIHLKHISVATTEGYAGKAGSSVGAFLSEVEHERRLAGTEAALAVFNEVLDGAPVEGLGASNLIQAMQDIAKSLGDGDVQVRGSVDVLRALLSQRANTLHLNIACLCWFTDPSRARCLRDQDDKSRPLTGMCQPANCVNATIHRSHAPVWLSGLDALTSSLKDKRVPSGERLRIKAQISVFQSVANQLSTPVHDPDAS